MYTWYLHNDCANYVSQSLYAGGVVTNSTWKKYTNAWVNCSGLIDFITSYDYYESTDFYHAKKGGIIMIGTSHVMVVTYNDSITHKFSAHSRDRKDCVYTNSSSTWTYYKPCNPN